MNQLNKFAAEKYFLCVRTQCSTVDRKREELKIAREEEAKINGFFT